MSRTEVISLGCRLNTFEAEMMREQLQHLGNTIVINTCAVTIEAERQTRQAIRRARRDNPDARLIVTGCAAQLNPAHYGAMPEVDKVLGNREKLDPSAFLFGHEKDPIVVSDIMVATETAAHLIHGFDDRCRAFVEIQQGCDHRCNFCIIPFARGPCRSVSFIRIIEQVRILTEQGFKEIVLTGVDICSYGTDLPGKPSLGNLVRRLLTAVPDLPRLRFSSLDPAAIDNTLYEILGEEQRVMPHFHLSIQALDDTILKRMKRRHLFADVEAVVANARSVRSDVVIGADLIAGFPTETDQQFTNTLTRVNELGITHLHVFPYSERPGTPAARMPQTAPEIRKERARALRETGATALAQFMANQVGTDAAVLVEGNDQGLSEHYVPVRINGDTMPGKIQAVTLTGAGTDHLVGMPA